MDFEKSLSYLFLQTANVFRVKLEREMNKIGLHYGQVFILISLCKTDGQSQRQLAKDLLLSAPTVNKRVKKLAENKFVECSQSPIDNRAMLVFLTDKGREAQGAFAELFHALQ